MTRLTLTTLLEKTECSLLLSRCRFLKISSSVACSRNKHCPARHGSMYLRAGDKNRCCLGNTIGAKKGAFGSIMAFLGNLSHRIIISTPYLSRPGSSAHTGANPKVFLAARRLAAACSTDRNKIRPLVNSNGLHNYIPPKEPL